MISMQRSLSSPVRVYSEPRALSSCPVYRNTGNLEADLPVDDIATSPTAHYDSNTPADKSHDTPVSPLQHLRSRSPPRSSSIAVPAPTVSLPFRRSEDGTRRSTYTPYSRASCSISAAVNTTKPLITHDLPHHSKHASFDSSTNADQNSPPSGSAGVPSPIIPKPLLQDTSLYTNPHLTREIESTTLEELAHLVRLSKFQERKRASTRIRLQRSLISTALSARLTRCGEIANRNLADNFRRDDKESFIALFNAVYDVRKSCQELRRFALLEPDSEPLLPPGSPSDTLDGSVNLDAGPLKPQNPFFDDLAASSRDTFLDFITQIRTNRDYLATRICALSSSELNALCASHKGLEPFDSVLPFQGRSSSRSHGASGSRNNASADIERLLSFHRHDPLSVLVHTCFANSAGPDSSEDRRRTDIWATALAKLISEPKSSGEHLVISVLNIWTTMREWSGRSNMEWFLLKILEDGAFLLDRAEDQHGTRFNLSDWNQSDEAAAADFYDHAVDELFELVDDEDATGIPEGLLELGHAILEKLDGPFLENTTRWLVWRCLFFVFFMGVIVHPESYGMLTEYHITPYAREKVLKKVAMKAHDYVSRMWTGKPSSTSVPQEIPPKIKGHVESIIARFQGTRPRVPAAKLLPARSITSLRETAEVHPYLVISPTELLTMVNALFPERRPQSSASMRSGPTPLSGMSSLSHPISITGSSNDFETASIISTSASSAPLGTPAMHERSKEFIEPMSPGRLSPTGIDQEAERKLRNYEDDGHRLRIALHEMAQSLGHDALQGSAHPCAERWAVLFISPDGRTLSTHMTYDPEEEVEEDYNSSSSDTDENSEDDGAQLDKDYLQLRDAILKLVEDYEIPQSLEPESESAHLSNRASRLRRYKSKNRIITPERSKPSRNPYRRRNHEDSPTRESATSSYHDHLPQAQEEPEAVLVTMLKAAAAQSKAHADFVSSHMYWKTLVQLNALDSPSLRQNGFSVLINIFSRGPRDSIRRSASAIEEYDAWLVWLKQSQERHDGSIERMMARIRAMRNKMWYVTEVRNSREYAHSRDICQALKTMGMPRRWSSFQRTRANLARGPGTSYLYRTESQIMDLLAAGEEQGGPNKLSGDQADVTLRWLKEYDVENFCRGEERIHRFCCEVDKCVSKLIAETISDAPVLWSSDLYKRDKLVFDRLRASEREASDDTSSIASDNERFVAGIGNRLSPLAKDLRTGLGQHEYFERTSSAQAMDFNTFWSPFQGSNSPGQLSRAYSPASSVTNLSSTLYNTAQPWILPQPSGARFSGRPGTAMSSVETIHQRRADTRVSKFLSDLKRSLTSLLLSDLGTQVFSRGSETDVWFRGLGQECIDRKDALDRRAKQRRKERGARGSGRPRVIEKKKSFGNLRGAGDNVFDQIDIPAGSPSSSTATPTTPRINTGQLSRKEDEFPFKKAYQRLLSMFTVHPNPFAKLMALKELEDLIVASVAVSGSRRSRRNRSDAGSSVVTDEEVPGKRSSSFDSVIENVKERRSLAMQQSLPLPGSLHPRQESSDVQSIMSVYTNHTDAVVNELQSLFRDASIRPSSLFRDLQLIAAFVPGVVLDRPELGKAFWNAGLAALQLKAEVCHTMVEMADEVVAARTQTRSATDALFTQPNVPLSSTGTPPPPSASYKLEDAGKMWAITAKEGSATAQRELALFYLSNPEYVERTTLPLSKPREVFKQAVMEKYGRGKSMSGGAPSSGINPPSAAAASGRVSGGNGNSAGGTANGGGSLETKEKDVRNDPGLMCVAVHWMDAAMRGGDELATSFLRQNDPWS